jgi:hypothetical protein
MVTTIPNDYAEDSRDDEALSELYILEKDLESVFSSAVVILAECNCERICRIVADRTIWIISQREPLNGLACRGRQKMSD